MNLERRQPASDGRHAGVGFRSGFETLPGDRTHSVVVYDCGCRHESITYRVPSSQGGLTGIGMELVPDGGGYRPCLVHLAEDNARQARLTSKPDPDVPATS